MNRFLWHTAHPLQRVLLRDSVHLLLQIGLCLSSVSCYFSSPIAPSQNVSTPCMDVDESTYWLLSGAYLCYIFIGQSQIKLLQPSCLARATHAHLFEDVGNAVEQGDGRLQAVVGVEAGGVEALGRAAGRFGRAHALCLQRLLNPVHAVYSHKDTDFLGNPH